MCYMVYKIQYRNTKIFPFAFKTSPFLKMPFAALEAENSCAVVRLFSVGLTGDISIDLEGIF